MGGLQSKLQKYFFDIKEGGILLPEISFLHRVKK